MSWRRQGGFEHLLRCLDTAFAAVRGGRPIRVLEAGCGGGQVLEFLHRRVDDGINLWGFDVIDVEPAIDRLAATDPRIDWRSRIRRAGPAEGWPFDDGTVDVVVSHHVLEHVHDLDAFMSEHHRVLRPGAVGVHVFPTSRLLIEPHLGVPFAHWPQSDAGRRRVLRAALTLGIGERGWQDRGVQAQLDYLWESTRFRTYGQVIRAGREAGLHVAAGPTLQYGVELISAARGRQRVPEREASLRPQLGLLTGLGGGMSTAIGQWVLPVTLFMRRLP